MTWLSIIPFLWKILEKQKCYLMTQDRKSWWIETFHQTFHSSINLLWHTNLLTYLAVTYHLTCDLLQTTVKSESNTINYNCLFFSFLCSYIFSFWKETLLSLFFLFITWNKGSLQKSFPSDTQFFLNILRIFYKCLNYITSYLVLVLIMNMHVCDTEE